MIIDNIKEIFSNSEKFNELVQNIKSDNKLIIKGLGGSSKALLFSLLFEYTGCPLIVITHDEDLAEILKDDIHTLLGEENVAFLPDQKDRPYELVFKDFTKKGQYQETLEKLSSKQKLITITTAKVICKKILPFELFTKQKIIIKKGEISDFEIFKSLLIDSGFNREIVVENYGEMSVHGGIIDIFPYSFKNPIRVEFFGDVIESIREFDVTTQRSIKTITDAIIYPQFPEDYQLTNNKYVSLFDYFSKESLVILEDGKVISEIVDQNFEEATFQYNVKHDKQKVNPPEEYYLTWNDVRNELKHFKQILFNSYGYHKKNYNFSILPQQSLRGNFLLLRKQVDRLIAQSINKILFLCGNNAQVDRLKEIMSDNGIDIEKIRFGVYPLNQGFISSDMGFAVLTDNQFYGRIRRGYHRKQFVNGLSFRQLKSLSIGDYVVHIDQGIGRYLGLMKITVNGTERECLKIEYKDGDLVYVPLEKMKRVQRYSAKEGFVPQMNKLGTNEWEKLKERTKKKVKDIARDLIKLYAKRRQEKGFAFSKDFAWQKELEATFDYEETPDQFKATQEIKHDMESEKPMDRLVCGDVGYGKTEVALRAAFKAVNDGKQVAILVPTTVLALQHFNTFQERLKEYPIKIEMLSRFRTKAEQKKIIEWLKEGAIDIIIGTHRLLSKDVSFKDLGLIVIDEEQRFGVRSKEKLKKIKLNVDVLTMTATPIPRTLNMSLIGVRDLSLINTPPRGRLPISTEVIPFEKPLIRMAILREIERGGQVFFVHNRIQSIHAVHDVLKKLVPEATFAIAHGQMDERSLEHIMWEFAHKKYDCLISTMIIESGLDIPNVNTLIINRADRFGLSQLYQLRGRVGRSNQRAYAYLIAPPVKNLTREAIKRLRTIEEYTELGSGFQIAMRDLHIRGAGNLLGGEQSGFIVSLGYELYTKILDEAIKEVRYELEGIGAPEAEELPETRVDLDVDAYLPEYYIEQPEERVRIYKRLVELSHPDEVSEMESEIRDRFGILPQEAKSLFYLIALKIIGTQLKLKHIRIISTEMFVQFHDVVIQENKELMQKKLVSIVNKAGTQFTFVQGTGRNLGIRVHLNDKVEDKLKYSKNFLQSLI